MRVVAFNGSPRWEGNTDRLIRKVLSVLEAEGIETEIVHILGRELEGKNPASSPPYDDGGTVDKPVRLQLCHGL